MTNPLLNQTIDNAYNRAISREGAHLYARINAFSVFRNKQVSQDEWPPFSPNLPQQTYEQAYDYLLLGLKELYQGNADKQTDAILEMAGELLAKLYFENPLNPPDRIPELYNAALAYYLSGHYARAFVIMKGLGPLADTPQSSSLLRMMFLKDINQIRRVTLDLLTNPSYTDTGIAGALEQGLITSTEAVERVLQATLNRVMSLFVEYNSWGHHKLIERSFALLETGIRFALDQKITIWWWLLYSTGAMIRECYRNSLWTHLQPMLNENGSGIVRVYIEATAQRINPVIELWRSQAKAIPYLNDEGRASYCVKMPTSSGKTRIAEVAILRFLLDNLIEDDKKCLYIAPYRALATEVEGSLRQSFGPLGIRVSELYGGFYLNPAEIQLLEETKIFIATPEKTDALLRYNPDLAAQVGLVIVDEGHIIDKGSRGLRYELFLHRLVRRFANQGIRILFISAVMPNVEQFTKWITNQDVEHGLIESDWRASTLFLGTLKWDGNTGRVDYLYQGIKPISSPTFFRFMSSLPLDELRLVGVRSAFPRPKKKSEIIALAGIEAVQDGATLIFAPQPKFVESIAKAVLKVLELKKCLAKNRGVQPFELPVRSDQDGKEILAKCIRLAEETTGPDSLVVKALRVGFVIHHGGIPTRLRWQIERLGREGVVSLTIATNTLAQGVNLPIKTVLIHSLVQGQDKYIPSTDFWNICGRAGRAMQENEGLVLLLADETNPPQPPSPFQTATAQAKWILEKYVREAKSQAVVSAIKQFLDEVITKWREIYPDANVAELCERLADNEIGWLPEDTQHRLDTLDAQLLALLEEAEVSEATPSAVQDLFERSLLLLQLNQPDPNKWLNTEVVVDIIISRITHIRKSTSEHSRRQFYRMGLTLSDCQYVKIHRSEIETILNLAQNYLVWSAEERSNYLVGLCQILIQLSDVRPDKASDLPLCWPMVVRQWLLGQTPEQIVQHPEIALELSDTMRVSAVIDDLCDYRLPWGFNALYTFWETGIEDVDKEVHQSSLPEITSYFASMIRYGVHSPGATILLAAGLESRQAAIVCAEQYKGVLELDSFLNWMKHLSGVEIEQWQLGSISQNSLLTFIQQVRQREQRMLDIEFLSETHRILIPDRNYLVPISDGTILIVQPIPPNQIHLYSPAIEYLSNIQVNSERTFKKLEDRKMVAIIHGDLRSSHSGWLETTIELRSN